MNETSTARPASTGMWILGSTGPFVLEGDAFQVQVRVMNTGKQQIRDASIVTRIRQGPIQGGTLRVADRAPVTCAGGAPGVIPAYATCDMVVTGHVTNTGEGSGTLTPGYAGLVMQLVQGAGRKQHTLFEAGEPILIVENGQPEQLFISDFQLGSTTFTLGGAPVSYSYMLVNPIDLFYEGVSILGVIRQGDNWRIAGSDHPNCGAGGPGRIGPNSSCGTGSSYVAWNGSGGEGTLTAGPAVLEIELRVSPQQSLQFKHIPITLQ